MGYGWNGESIKVLGESVKIIELIWYGRVVMADIVWEVWRGLTLSTRGPKFKDGGERDKTGKHLNWK